MSVTFASGRSQLSSLDWTITTTPDCGCLTSKSLYFTLQAMNASGVNVPIMSDLIEIDTNERLVITILETAKLAGEGWTHFVIGCSATNDPTTTNQIAKIPCCQYDSLDNIDLLTPVSFPIVVNFEYDHQLSLGELLDTVSELPSTNLISGIRYALVEKGNNVYEYDQYSSATVDGTLVLSATTGRWLLKDEFSTYISNAQYLGGCSVDLLNLSNFDTITIPNYLPNGGNSPIVKYYLVNDTGGDIPEGYAIFLNVQVGGYNKSDLFDQKIEYYIEGLVDTTTGILRTNYYGTSDELQFLNIQKTHSSRFPTLVLEDVVKSGEAVLLTLILRCDLLEIQGKLPNTQIQILPEMLPMSGTFNPLGGLFEKGIILSETGFDKRRVLPNEGLSVKVQSGVGIVKDFNFWKPSTSTVLGLTANSTNEIYISKDGDLYIDTEEASDSTLRAIVKCEVKESKLSDWSSYSAVTLNSALLVTVNYPCDSDLNATIRSTYPDVIAGLTGTFNANKVNIYIQRQSDGEIRKFSDLTVVVLTLQQFTITDWSSGTVVVSTPTDEVSFYNPLDATFSESLGTGNLIATNYRVAYTLGWDGNTVSDISHAVADGCIVESLLTGEQVFGSNVYNTLEQIRAITDFYDGKEIVCLINQNTYKYFSTGSGDDDGFDVIIPTSGIGRWINVNRQDYFSKVYKQGELQPQAESFNFVDDRFDIELFDDKLNVKLNNIPTMWDVDEIPDINFDYSQGVRSGDSARLTYEPYAIYDCKIAEIGEAVWQERGSGSGGGSATDITVDTTNFNVNLSGTDTTVQEALETLDELVAGGGVVFKGNWNSGTSYNQYDAVGYQGSSYIANESNLNKNPSTEPEWDLWVEKGDIGNDGGIISTISITTTFTIPSVSSTQTQDFDDVIWVSVGATVLFSDGTNYAYLEVTAKSTNTLTLKNTWGKINGTTIGIGGVLSPSGIPGLDGTDGDNGVNADVTRTSTSSVEIGTGSKSFTYSSSPNLGWGVGSRLRVSYDASNYVEGVATDVSPTSTAIDVDNAVGSGTYTSWNIAISGDKGVTGSNIELQKTSTHIQWRTVGGSWVNLTPLSDINTTVSLGTVTTGATGSNVVITNSGTPSNAIFNFAIPKGDTGATGGIGTVNTHTINLVEATANNTVSTAINLPKSMLIYKITASCSIRIRQYLSANYQTSDLSRSSTTSVTGDHGCYYDLITKAVNGFIRNLAPPAIAISDGIGYFSITNLESTTQNINIQITALSLEA